MPTESLEICRYIPATPEEVFVAWTTPSALKQWWGPENVRCVEVKLDLTPGGHYQISNQLADHSLVLIEGVFERIDPPVLLIYTWRTTPGPDQDERVTVRFQAKSPGTEVCVKHERIATAAVRDQHQEGWEACLNGLQGFIIP